MRRASWLAVVFLLLSALGLPVSIPWQYKGVGSAVTINPAPNLAPANSAPLPLPTSAQNSPFVVVPLEWFLTKEELLKRGLLVPPKPEVELSITFPD